MTKARDLADLGNGVTQADLPAEGVNESKLQVSNAPTNGYALTAQSGNTGGLTWAETGTADDSVSEAKLQVSNAPTNGYMLTAQSGNTGGLTWAAAPTASTTYGAVGTYVLGRRATSIYNQTEFLPGTTYAGSSLYPAGISAVTASSVGTYNTTQIYNGDINSRATALSGTWRAMGENNHDDTYNPMTLFVRTA